MAVSQNEGAGIIGRRRRARPRRQSHMIVFDAAVRMPKSEMRWGVGKAVKRGGEAHVACHFLGVS